MKVLLKDLFGIIKSEPIVVPLLILVFLQISGMFLYTLLLLVPYSIYLCAKNNLLDRLTIWIILYSTTYAMFTYFNGWYVDAKSNVLFQSLCPPTMYIIGKHLSEKRNIYVLLLLCISLLAIKPIIWVILDIYNTGQLVNPERMMDFYSGSSLSATNIGAMVSLSVSSFGCLFALTSTRQELSYKIILFFLSLLGLLAVVHLINRTGLIIVVVSIVSVFCLNFSSHKSHKVLYFFVVGLFLFILFRFMYENDALSDVMSFYEKRNIEGHDLKAGGGRFLMWKYGLSDVMKHPLGCDTLTRNYYSHNYWIDTASTGGLLASFYLLVATIIHTKTTFSLIKSRITVFVKSLFLIINVGFFVTCMVEPVMEANQLLVFMLFLFIGFSQGYYNLCK